MDPDPETGQRWTTTTTTVTIVDSSLTAIKNHQKVSALHACAALAKPILARPSHDPRTHACVALAIDVGVEIEVPGDVEGKVHEVKLARPKLALELELDPVLRPSALNPSALGRRSAMHQLLSWYQPDFCVSRETQIC